MQVLNITTTSELPSEGIVCHDVREPADRNVILARKGTRMDAADIDALLQRGVGELHVAVPAADDIAEDEAAERLGRAVAGGRVRIGEARFGQTNLVSGERGMLRVHAARLERVHVHDGVLLLTAEADRPVDAGTTVGVIKCAPLYLEEATLLAVENDAITDGPTIDIQPFQPARVGLVAPRERLRGGAFDRAQAALSNALAWYGSSLDHVVGSDATVESLAAAYHTVRHAGTELILAAGASGTDPLDVVFEGLRQAGGQVLQIGIPAEPGTACWIGRLDDAPVLGLASCELFGQPGALDLLLPRLLTGEDLDQQLLRRLALGGLLLGPSRIAPYHASATTDAAK